MSVHWGGRGAAHINRLPRAIGALNPFSGATMLLDFTNPVLDPRITFSRGTGATRVNASGFIEVVGNTDPRFDYDPVTLAPRGLLIEEARTNLLVRSEEFDNASWVKTSATVTANSTNAPSGTVSADTFIPGNGINLGAAILNQDISKAASAVTYAVSVYVKAAGYNRVLIRCQDSGGTTNRADVVVSLVDGAITGAATAAGTFSAASAIVQNAANGFYRIALTFTSSTDPFLRTMVLAQDSVATVGNGTSGIFLYGAQLEAGAFATSYIPTVASTVSRSADVATMTGTNFSSWYNQNEGTFVFNFGAFNFAGVMAGSGPYDAAIGAVTNGVRAGRQFSAQNFNGWVVQNKTGTPVGTAAISGSSAFGPISGPVAAHRLAIFQTPSSAGGVVNGGVVSSTALTVAPTGTADMFYINPSMNGWFRAIAYYNTRLPNTQLQTLTAPSLASPLALDFLSTTYTVGY